MTHTDMHTTKPNDERMEHTASLGIVGIFMRLTGASLGRNFPCSLLILDRSSFLLRHRFPFTARNRNLSLAVAFAFAQCPSSKFQDVHFDSIQRANCETLEIKTHSDEMRNASNEGEQQSQEKQKQRKWRAGRKHAGQQQQQPQAITGAFERRQSQRP
jgi:hypothetical protein